MDSILKQLTFDKSKLKNNTWKSCQENYGGKQLIA